MNDATPKNSNACVNNISSKFEVLRLMDPRSPTTAFPRTPIQVALEKPKTITDNLESITDCIEFNSTAAILSSPCPSISSLSLNSYCLTNVSISSSSFVSAEDDMDIDNVLSDPSMNVSDFSVQCGINNTELSENLENINQVSEKTDCKSEIVKKEIANSSDLIKNIDYNTAKTPNNSLIDTKKTVSDKTAKKLFYALDKKRNPLESVDNIFPVTPPSHFPYNSPQNVLRQKHWKRIQEERKKLGLESDENIPLPLYDITASAPSKLMLRKKKMNDKSKILS